MSLLAARASAGSGAFDAGEREIGFNSLLLTLPTEILIKDNVLAKLVSQPTGGQWWAWRVWWAACMPPPSGTSLGWALDPP